MFFQLSREGRASGRAARDVLRGLRRDSSLQQQKLWFELRRKALDGYQFRRQHLICGVVVVFYCPQRNLVIEVDMQLAAGEWQVAAVKN